MLTDSCRTTRSFLGQVVVLDERYLQECSDKNNLNFLASHSARLSISHQPLPSAIPPRWERNLCSYPRLSLLLLFGIPVPPTHQFNYPLQFIRFSFYTGHPSRINTSMLLLRAKQNSPPPYYPSLTAISFSQTQENLLRQQSSSVPFIVQSLLIHDSGSCPYPFPDVALQRAPMSSLMLEPMGLSSCLTFLSYLLTNSFSLKILSLQDSTSLPPFLGLYPQPSFAGSSQCTEGFCLKQSSLLTV